MIHELRTYTVHPGRLGDYVTLAGSVGRPIRGDRFGKLLGYWSTELGPLNQVVHLWEFADLAARTAARAGLAQDERWAKEYLPRTAPLLQRQENMILAPAAWYPVRSMAGMGIYELRVYRLTPGKVAEYLEHFRTGMAAREKYSAPVGIWTTDIGPLNTVVHLWGYRDMAHRGEVRQGASGDPGWQAFIQKGNPLLQVMESKLLTPTSFSPLR